MDKSNNWHNFEIAAYAKADREAKAAAVREQAILDEMYEVIDREMTEEVRLDAALWDAHFVYHPVAK